MREEVKITKIVLEDEEIECIRTIASIDCAGIECGNCPLLYERENERYCLKRLVRNICSDNGITYNMRKG